MSCKGLPPGDARMPGFVFSIAPNGTPKYAEQMFKTGVIKTMPSSWKDVFSPRHTGCRVISVACSVVQCGATSRSHFLTLQFNTNDDAPDAGRAVAQGKMIFSFD